MAITRWLMACALLACAACGVNGSDGQSNTAAPSALSYTTPVVLTAGQAATPLTPSVSGSVTNYSVDPALPAGLSIAAATGVISGAPTVGNALSNYTVTAGNSGGTTTFALQLAVSVGPTGEFAITGNDGPSVVSLSNLAPASGDSVTATVALPAASTITLATSGSGCGALAGSTVQGAMLSATGTVAAAGSCVLQADVTTPDGTRRYGAQFQVAPTRLPSAAGGLAFAGGAYVSSGDIALLPTSSTVSIDSAAVPQTLVNGGTGSIVIASASGANVTQAVVTFDGIPGYYTAPIAVVNGQMQLTLDVSQNFISNLQAGGVAMRLAPRVHHSVRAASAVIRPKMKDVRAAPVDTNALTATLNATLRLRAPDGLSPPYPLPLPLQEVGSGPIQVSLQWQVPTDVDLHVVTPAGEEIYYANRADSTGGSLDLDSNAGCDIDNVDQENIVWLPTTTPASGNYTVRVDYWDSCKLPQTISYSVKTTVCGVTKTYPGTLDAAQADQGAAGAGLTVATFAYTPCTGLSVAGSANYEDFPPSAGQPLGSRMLPIRYATVEVHQSSPDVLLATGSTDAAGNYNINFAMNTPAKYFVKVLASSTNLYGAPYDQEVINDLLETYSVSSDPIDAAVTPHATGIKIQSTAAGSHAGAFNIYNVGLNSYNFVQATYGTTLPFLTWQWTPGVATCGGKASCYVGNGVGQTNANIILVLSTSDRSDEYQDSVLAHEFGHFFMYTLSRNTPSTMLIEHGPLSRSDPYLAWSEGAATFFGQSVLGYPFYLERNTDGSVFANFNLETPGAGIPMGTADGSLAGPVSEAAVYAILWDLADLSADSVTVSGLPTITDTLFQPDNVWSALGAFKSTTNDRGAPGTDLADFLDFWMCRGYSNWAPNEGNNINGMVNELNQYPYQPATPPNCS